MFKRNKASVTGNPLDRIEIHHIFPEKLLALLQDIGRLGGIGKDSGLPALSLSYREHKIINKFMNPFLNADTAVGARFLQLDANEKFSVIIEIYRKMDGGVNQRFGDYAEIMELFGRKQGVGLMKVNLPDDVKSMVAAAGS